jgi:hypothetical protein
MNVVGRHYTRAEMGGVEGSGAIGQEAHFVAEEHFIAGACVAAALGDGSTNDDRRRASAAQDNVKIRPEERGVAMLLDHMLADNRR